ncbi:DUF507 family protein [Candidatus Magnetominusculus xianensis]|uniref:Protein containing DUF507 n=1 Tax=Candidatus Magnetominusculus xianensis TaxID=1748249 RepID=A0ABR5SIY7_9BACT|nr:DUF507 family protein [Candidatus Magnetominusculus xianensis]KWT91680.1 hypothetical protein ASN18_0798 [Candidatus Magnetominusculus xianensis]MBF0404564.1 DUF507 family protein [Nitrospirota bacterium]
MMLSDDKINHLSHILLIALKGKDLITTKADDSIIRKEIKKSIAAEIKTGEEIDADVRRKLSSFSKKLTEGSSEWEILYKKFYAEESSKKGR